MPAFRITRYLFFWVAICSTAQAVIVAPPGNESANYNFETIRKGLDNPWGLAVRGGRSNDGPHELFVAESGAGQVIRILTNHPHELHEAIVGFPVSECKALDSARLGPLGLNFLTRTKLIVTCAEQTTGQEKVAVYVLPGDNTSVSAEAYDHAVGPLRKTSHSSTTTYNFFSATKTEIAAFIVSISDRSSGQILRAAIGSNRLESLRTISQQDETSGLTAPSAIAMLPSLRPHLMVLADWGKFATPRDSQLVYLSPATGRIAMRLATGLDDISGLAYSSSGKLYATDCAWHDADRGGVFRIDDARIDGQQACRTVRIATVARPTSLAFAPDGALYVVTFGDDANPDGGKLIKITGEF